jgi:hypothetical protein
VRAGSSLTLGIFMTPLPYPSALEFGIKAPGFDGHVLRQ